MTHIMTLMCHLDKSVIMSLSKQTSLIFSRPLYEIL